MKRILLVSWEIIVQMGCPDRMVLHAEFIGHPTVSHGTPGTFVEFSATERTARSLSGREYKFATSFLPNGNARTESEAFKWIQENWVKKPLFV